jgi:uncharacterized protein (UPF0276 family)
MTLSQVGIGLRQPHYADWLAQRPPLGFVEVHAENFFASGGATLALLDELRAHHPVSLHGVGLSLGSACGLDSRHLDQLARLVERVDPIRVSEHVCFARVRTEPSTLVHASDLLPVAFTPASLGIMIRHVSQVQDRLKRPILVEHLSAALRCQHSTMTERDFLVALCEQSGCQLLLDVNNLMVNGMNERREAAWLQQDLTLTKPQAEQHAVEVALGFIQSLPPALVGEIHLAGCGWPQEPGAPVIDDHSQRMSPSNWQLYEAALAHLGPLPSLVEWDTNLPSLDVLIDEAEQAAQRQHLMALKTTARST